MVLDRRVGNTLDNTIDEKGNEVAVWGAAETVFVRVVSLNVEKMQKAEQAVAAARRMWSEACKAMKECDDSSSPMPKTVQMVSCTHNSLKHRHETFNYIKRHVFNVTEEALMQTRECRANVRQKVALLDTKFDELKKANEEVGGFLKKAVTQNQQRTAKRAAAVASVYRQVLDTSCESAARLNKPEKH
ncbi:hypothetical protein ERJ75_001587200 [Trypanosoma vivax]|nr:hypothetical protein ERJ75_001587200 [Trypanosoma vivax]